MTHGAYHYFILLQKGEKVNRFFGISYSFFGISEMQGTHDHHEQTINP